MYKFMVSIPIFVFKVFIKIAFRNERLAGYLKMVVDKKYYQNLIFHYSQEGEDIILARLFANKENGFYVDVGAHHPTRFSNTYLLYCRGWRGINIDSMPGAMVAFMQTRPQDINLEMGISLEEGTMPFFIFAERALNTLDEKLAKQRMAEGLKLECISDIPVTTINFILRKYLPENTHIDLLTIDIKGFDELVLGSFDFALYQPTVIVCEVLDSDIETVVSSKIASILRMNGYVLYSKLINSVVWRKTNVLE